MVCTPCPERPEQAIAIARCGPGASVAINIQDGRVAALHEKHQVQPPNTGNLKINPVSGMLRQKRAA